MRLTSLIRSRIVNNVLAALPKEVNKNYQDEVTMLVQKHMLEELPPEVRKIYDNPKTRGYLHKHYHYAKPFSFSVCVVRNPDGPTAASRELQQELDDMYGVMSANYAAKSSAITKLNQALNSCTTDNQLVERYPELAKYIPDFKADKSTGGGAIVVQNPLKEFKELGLPMQVAV